MIATVDVEIQAANPNMPLHPWRAFVNSPSSLRLRNVPKRVGDWHITAVKIVAAYPDGAIKAADCVLTGGVWVGTIAGTSTSGTSKNGYTVFADGIDENGNPVTGYVLGKGDITIMEADGSLNPDAPSYYVHLYDEQPENPREGDLYPTADGYRIWQGGQAVSLGITQSQLNAALAPKQDKLSQQQLANIAAVPNKLDTARYHGDYIEDERGNRINANLAGKQTTGEYVWIATSAFHGTLTLRGTYNQASYFPENPEADQLGLAIDISEGSSSSSGYDDFTLTAHFWREVDGNWQWVPDSGGSAGLIPIGGHHYSDDGWRADYQWQTNSVSDIKLATEDFAVRNDGGVAKIKSISQADYDALTSPDSATLYVIPEEADDA